tara:strand:+ start:123 stop:380 length:258 start_codon:yes stop_codon:yes gene_type:complete
MSFVPIPFKIMAKSENTNSFGLYQMFAISEEGTVYKTHATQYYAKEKGETIFLSKSKGLEYFQGHEMTEKLPKKAPKEIISEFWS